METIANAGIEVGIGVAPVIPGYSEADIPKLLERAKQAGATRAFMSMLHLDSDSIEEYFVAKMHERLSPPAVKKIVNAMKRERGGQLQHRSFKERSEGRTEQWEVTKKLFDFHAKRLGFRQHEMPAETEMRTPAIPAQQSLF
jgi:DNA repair photolyase